MAVATEGFAAWLTRADIPASRRTPQLDALLQAVFRFREQQGSDYYSSRLLSHFLLHCDCGLKVAHIARLIGIARPTASKQQGMSSKAAIQQAHHRMDGRAHGKLLPRYAGPIAAFLLGHPKASQTEQIDFVAATFAVRVSRIALYKFLKKYGLHKLTAADQPAASAGAVSDLASTLPVMVPSATASLATPASVPVITRVPLIAAQPLTAPAPVIDLAKAVEPNKASAPPFSSDGRNTPARSC